VPLCLVNEAVEHLRRALISASYASSAKRVMRRVEEEGNEVCIEEDGGCLLLLSRSLALFVVYRGGWLRPAFALSLSLLCMQEDGCCLLLRCS
jgi:hypothetical protein